MRRYSLKEKLGYVKDSLSFDTNQEAAAALDIAPSSLSSWSGQYVDYVTDPKYKTFDEIVDDVRKKVERKSKSERKKRAKSKRLPEKIIGKTFVDKLKYLKSESGLTSRELHEMTGVSTAAIDLMMRTLSVPRQSTVKKFIDAFDYPARQWRSPTYEGEGEISYDSPEQGHATRQEKEPEPKSLSEEFGRYHQNINLETKIEELEEKIQCLSIYMGKIQDMQISLMSVIMQCIKTQQKSMEKPEPFDFEKETEKFESGF